MSRPHLQGALLCTLSGLLLALSFYRPPLFLLAWVALLPLLNFLMGSPPPGTLFLGHLLFTLPYFGGVLYWIPRVLIEYGQIGPLPAFGVFAVMLLAMSAFLLPFSVLVGWGASRRPHAILAAVPGLWLLTELARNYYLVNGFPWALVGYSQFPYLELIQVADLGGVYLVSGVVVAGNAAFLAALRARRFRPLLYFLPVFLAANLYGVWRLHLWSPRSTAAVRVALAQPGIGLFEDQEHYALKYFETLPELYKEGVEQEAGWVIFPEAPNPFMFQEDFYYTTFWEALTSERKTGLLFNTTLRDPEASQRYFNAAVLLDSGGQVAYRYQKTHLVPFGEYVPWRQWLEPWFQPLVQEVSAFSPGESLEVGTVAGIRFGTLICYEAIFPELSRDLSRLGAEVLVNLTNDTWYGLTAAPTQHFQMAVFRAIETRKPLLRAANTGISAFVDAWGRTERSLELFEEGLLTGIVVGNRDRSIYSRTGEWINIFLAGVTIFLVALPLGSGRKKPNRRRKARK